MDGRVTGGADGIIAGQEGGDDGMRCPGRRRPCTISSRIPSNTCWKSGVAEDASSASRSGGVLGARRSRETAEMSGVGASASVVVRTCG